MLPKYVLGGFFTMHTDISETPNFDLELSPFGENVP